MAHVHLQGAQRHVKDCFVGVCPACGERVLWDDSDGPVWICPADLSEDNPYRQAPSEDLPSQEEQERIGVFSNCVEDYDASKWCHDRMPLHSRCHEKGNY